ncbi:MAG: STAS domain-containing protein [Deltaproteobacteria bacterium]|nr:MAG: STAS domain-containing protein [Deltaproteobacteria bacterium]
MTSIEKKETVKIIPQVVDKGILILRIIGYIDASNASLFSRLINEQLNRRYSNVILDFSELQYMYLNNSALGIFMKIYQSVASRQGEIGLLKLPQEVEKTLVKLGLTKYFRIFSEEKKATRYFNEKEEK